jgi:hypothetical protein
MLAALRLGSDPTVGATIGTQPQALTQAMTQAEPAAAALRARLWAGAWAGVPPACTAGDALGMAAEALAVPVDTGRGRDTAKVDDTAPPQVRGLSLEPVRAFLDARSI